MAILKNSSILLALFAGAAAPVHSQDVGPDGEILQANFTTHPYFDRVWTDADGVVHTETKRIWSGTRIVRAGAGCVEVVQQVTLTNVPSPNAGVIQVPNVSTATSPAACPN